MFGLRDEFSYFECADCGCLQLENPPSEMRRYYPADYYAFAEPTAAQPSRRGWLRRLAERRRTEAQLFGGRGLGRLLAWMRPRQDLLFLKHVRLGDWNTRILDVGCGNGLLLRKLALLGFRDLVGVDPFLPGDHRVSPGLRLFARRLEDLPEADFDLVMFHHSLEHMPNQAETLRSVTHLLRPNGVCLVRVPVASCAAWNLYGTDWVELDAPRHFFLHTHQSFDLLSRRCGLDIYHHEHEPLPMAYWGSALYQRGLTLYDPERKAMRSPRSVFSPEEMRRFEHQAAQASPAGQGGPAAFYLRHAS